MLWSPLTGVDFLSVPALLCQAPGHGCRGSVSFNEATLEKGGRGSPASFTRWCNTKFQQVESPTEHVAHFPALHGLCVSLLLVSLSTT